MPSLSQAQIQELINGLIIDNTTQQINPAKLRSVLHAINEAGQTTDLQAVSAERPLEFDQFNNILSLPPIKYPERRVIAKDQGNLQRYLEEGDIIMGWSPDGKSWWDSAIYNGGVLTDVDNYTVIVGSQVKP